MDDNERLQDYAHGRLDSAETTAVEAELAQNPDLRAELAMMTAVRDHMRNDGPDQSVKDAGWDRLSQTIDATRFGTPANDNRRFSLAQVAGITAAAVVAWQFVAVPLFFGNQDTGFTTASAVVEGPALRVLFADAATVEDITTLIRDAGGTITDGPSAIGLFTVVFENDAAFSAAQTAFSQHPDLVVGVTLP